MRDTGKEFSIPLFHGENYKKERKGFYTGETLNTV